MLRPLRGGVGTPEQGILSAIEISQQLRPLALQTKTTMQALSAKVVMKPALLHYGFAAVWARPLP